MLEAYANAFWLGLAVYLIPGAVLALWLFLAGFRRTDPQAAIAPAHVKMLWLPGIVFLWPLLLSRTFGVTPPEDRG